MGHRASRPLADTKNKSKAKRSDWPHANCTHRGCGRVDRYVAELTGGGVSLTSSGLPCHRDIPAPSGAADRRVRRGWWRLTRVRIGARRAYQHSPDGTHARSEGRRSPHVLQFQTVVVIAAVLSQFKWWGIWILPWPMLLSPFPNYAKEKVQLVAQTKNERTKLLFVFSVLVACFL